MEGEVKAVRLGGLFMMIAVLSLWPWRAGHAAQKTAPEGAEAEISLRKTVEVKKFQDKDVEGEQRLIGRGDSLWRILIEEKGLPGQKFQSYIVVIRGLNPQIKNLDVLRIGDKVFVPIRPDEVLEARARSDGAPAERAAPGRGVTAEYRVKAGEHLYQILREQLKLADERRLAQYYALVKDLNPERTNWDKLLEGEIIRLPTTADRTQETLARGQKPAAAPARGGRETAAADGKAIAELKMAPERQPAAEIRAVPESKPASPASTDSRQALGAPAQNNMVLFARVLESMGSEFQASGEEVVAAGTETVRFDKSKFPVVYSPALRQRVVIDPNDQIPESLRKRLGDPNVRTQVLPMDNGVSVQQAVGQLLARLGYQNLPAERPVIIQEDGIAYEAKGDWMALGPEESNKTQEVFVINLTDNPHEIPDYLKAQLAKRGLRLREVVWPPANAQAEREPMREPITGLTQVKTWPRAKEEMVDALLLSYGVPFGVGEGFSVDLRDGLRVEARTDRVFEVGGKRTALFFRPGDVEVRRALREQQGFRTEELNLAGLTSRELIANLLRLLGDEAAYREHRFPVAHDSARDRLTVKAWGFHLNNRPLFVTDRQIPVALHRFFFEKGLEIVYFH
jgi:hypothetical protein